MSKKSNKEDIIKRFRVIHGDKYDYSKVEYVNTDTKVCIICPKHGEFWQSPYKHMQGQGCKLCSRPVRDTISFIQQSKKIHGDRYDYSKVEYITTHEKVCIICPEHGEFWITPANHLFKKGCPKCVGKNKTTKDVIEQFAKIHNNRYDYSKVEYVNSDTKVCIICPEHGEFWQSPNSHLQGNGCPKCAGKFMDTNFFIECSLNKHNGKYDYSKTVYGKNNTDKVCIICPEHGEFWQSPREHLNGCGCPKCSKEKSAKNRVLCIEEYIKRANEIHQNKYDYSKVEYSNLKEKVCIICPEHGEFWQEAFSHLSGCGCPKCGHFLSKGEMYIKEYIEHLDISVEERKRDIISPYEIDIYLPEKKIGIEFNGLIWHSDKFIVHNNYHLMKTELCKNKDISLIHIFEDEYKFKASVVLNKIKHLIGKSYDLPKIYGRKCVIKTIPYKESYAFLEKYHIQGGINATVYYGAFYDDNLIGVMTFKRLSNKTNEWELTRFASDYNYICCGIGGKLFKHFVKEYNPTTVKSFADRRWTINEEKNIYIQLGFKFEKYTKPDYHYVIHNGYKRIHKFNLRKKQLLKLYGEKYHLTNDMTENEMVNKVGIKKIYDCGLIKYVWEREK